MKTFRSFLRPIRVNQNFSHVRKFKYTMLKIKYLHKTIYITFLHISINNLTQSLSSLENCGVVLLKRKEFCVSFEVQFGAEKGFSFQAGAAALCGGVGRSQRVRSGSGHRRATALLRVWWVAGHLAAAVGRRPVVVAVVISCGICNKLRFW